MNRTRLHPLLLAPARELGDLCLVMPATGTSKKSVWLHDKQLPRLFALRVVVVGTPLGRVTIKEARVRV